jgi:heptaprenyl diphosphate synthase
MGLFGAPTLFALAADRTGELATLLLSPRFSERDMPAVRALVTAHGGLTAAVRLARERYQRALAAVTGLMPSGPRQVLVATAAWPGSE